MENQHSTVLAQTQRRDPVTLTRNPFLLLQITVLASPYSDRIQVTTSMAQGMEQPEMLWVMGPVLAVVLIVIFVIAILLFKK